MTEAEWLAYTNSQKMLEFIRQTVTDRKLRLFAVACSRRFLHQTQDHRVGDALDIAERFADGLVGDVQRSNARKVAQQAAQVRGVVHRPDIPKWERRIASLAYYAVARHAMEAAWNVPQLAIEVLVWHSGGYNSCDWQSISTVQEKVHCNLILEIIGNPFRPVFVEPAWLSWSEAVIPRLALAAYEERELPSGELSTMRLAILADALEEAGCAEASLLEH